MLRTLIREAIVKDAVMLLLVPVNAPLVGGFVRAYVTADPRSRIHTLELPVPPERSVHRVTLAAIRAYVSPLARFVDGTFSLLVLLMLRVIDVVSVHPFVPQR